MIDKHWADVDTSKLIGRECTLDGMKAIIEGVRLVDEWLSDVSYMWNYIEYIMEEKDGKFSSYQ